MKKLFLVLLFPCLTQAAPFLVSDPDPTKTADTCVYQEGTVVTRTPLVNNACKVDLGSVTTGAHNYTVWFESSLWGTQSASVPFTFARPASISSPATLRLAL